jgi:hypothetical protein
MVVAELMPEKLPSIDKVLPLSVSITSPSPVMSVTDCGVVGIGDNLARYTSCACAVTVRSDRLNPNRKRLDKRPSFIITSWLSLLGNVGKYH